MTQTAKILGPTISPGNTPTALYTVPAATQSVVSTLIACNVGTDDQIYVQVVPDGYSPGSYFILYNLDVPIQQSYIGTFGITLATGDSVWVYCNSGQIQFTLFGMENT